MKKIFYVALTVLMVLTSCAKEDFGITEIDNPRAEKKVTMYGSISFYLIFLRHYSTVFLICQY